MDFMDVYHTLCARRLLMDFMETSQDKTTPYKCVQGHKVWFLCVVVNYMSTCLYYTGIEHEHIQLTWS